MKTKEKNIEIDGVTFKIEMYDSSFIDTSVRHFINSCKRINEASKNLKTIPKIIFDFGGNVGFTPLYLSNKFPSAKIITVEADPNNLELLRRNSKNNKNIIIIDRAIDYEGKRVKFFTVDKPNEINFGAFSTNEETVKKHIKNESIKSISVKTITMEKIVKKHGLPDFFQIDIEGGEFAILENDIDIVKKIPVTNIEIHREGFKTEDIKKLFENSKQVVYFENNKNPHIYGELINGELIKHNI